MNHGYFRESTESLKEIGEIAKKMADIKGLEVQRNSIERRINNEY